MGIVDFCGEVEFSMIQYIFVLTKKVEKKIQKRKLFYEEQIKRYIKKRVDQFFIGSTLEESLIMLYKHQIYNAVIFRLQPLLREKNFLHVV